VALTYERLVEEGAMVGELEGAEKEQESMLGLMRAWRFLQRRFGSVYINFGEPLSLVREIGDRREALTGEGEAAVHERRVFVEQLGQRLVERMNRAIVPHATSVAACALLGERRRGLFRSDLALRMQQLVDMLRIMDVELTPALMRDEGDFSESIAQLLRMDLIRATEDARGEILYFEPSRRRALDIYRNMILHFLATPSFVARELLVGGSREQVLARVHDWLDLLHGEFFTAADETRDAHVADLIAHFTSLGWIREEDGVLRATPEGESDLVFLADQMRAMIESYYVAFSAVAQIAQPTGRKALRKVIAEQFERSELLGEAGLPEANNGITFGNAVDWLVGRGVLAPGEADGADRRDPPYGRGPAWDELSEHVERLAAALADR